MSEEEASFEELYENASRPRAEMQIEEIEEELDNLFEEMATRRAHIARSSPLWAAANYATQQLHAAHTNVLAYITEARRIGAVD